MKRKLAVLGLLGFAALFGCSQVDDGSVSAGLPEGFIEVQESKIYGSNTTKFKDIDTGCYFIRAEGIQAVAMVQMFVEKDGVSVPYCD